MAYLFIDDGCPESTEYDNNYIYFNENESGILQRIFELFSRKIEKNGKEIVNWKSQFLNKVIFK